MSEQIKNNWRRTFASCFCGARTVSSTQIAHPEAASVFRKTASAMAMVNFCLRSNVRSWGEKNFHFS